MPVGVALDISPSPIENKWGSPWCPGWLDRYAFEMLTLPNDGWKVINRWGWGVASLMNWSPLLTLWVVLMTTCGATSGGGAVGLAMFCFQWWSYWICFSCMYILYQDAIKPLFIFIYLNAMAKFNHLELSWGFRIDSDKWWKLASSKWVMTGSHKDWLFIWWQDIVYIYAFIQ